MGSSPGFVSNPSNCPPFKTRFRFGSGCLSLNLAADINSLAHSPKGTPSGLARSQRDPTIALRPFVSTRFQVLFHSPYRGSFHLSLTVLVRYRSSNVFSLGRWTSLLPAGLACPAVLRASVRRRAGFVYGTVTLCGPSFQLGSTTCPSASNAALQPRQSVSVGLGFSPFARHYSGNAFFSWRY